jgi:phage portal protein BeeE
MGKDNFFTNIASKLPFNYRVKAAETDDRGSWMYWHWLNEACRSFYSPNDCERLTDRNAYALACSLAEIFFPVDAIADRVSSLPFRLVNAAGEAVEPSGNIRRLLENPNPFATFSGNMYDAVFNELTDGNNYIYSKIASSFRTVTPDTLSGVYVLRPDRVGIQLKQKRPRYFEAKDASDLIEYYGYTSPDDTGSDRLAPGHIIHERSINAGNRRSGLKASSPLMSAKRNVDALIAVYEARYKVYVHNGMAGILTRKAVSKGDKMIDAVEDPVTRKRIADDILDRYGLTGNKQITAISNTPLEFIKTLATINELQPFDETMADALQIAGVYGVDKDLIPLKEGTTFTNKERAEKNLYQNVIMGVARDKARSFTKAYALDTAGLRLVPDFSGVPVLQDDREVLYKGDAQLIDNILKLKAAGLLDEGELKDIINRITDSYKNG